MVGGMCAAPEGFSSFSLGDLLAGILGRRLTGVLVLYKVSENYRKLCGSYTGT